MNKVQLLGRLTRDVELRYAGGENATAVGRTSVAVQRKFKNAEGNYDADFINLVAFGKTAEFMEKYFKKGSPVAVTGEIRTGSYTNKDGVKVYTTDVNVSDVEFVPQDKNGGAAANTSAAPKDDFMNIPENVGEELPFN